MSASPAAPAFFGSVCRVGVVSLNGATYSQFSLIYNEPTVGSITPADMTELATAFNAKCKTHILACIPPTAALSWLYISEIKYGTCPSAQFNFAGGDVGTAGATSLAQEVAVIFTKYSSLKGKHGRGRIFMPSIPNTFVTPATDPDVVNGTGVTAYETLKGDFESILTAASGKVWTPYIVTTPPPPDVLVSLGVPMIRMVVRTILSTVRRRRKGRGI